jgi:hypothetical protein
MINKKEFLLKKNKGRLELNVYLQNLRRAGVDVEDSMFLTLEDSERYLERLRSIKDKQSDMAFSREEDLPTFLSYVEELVSNSNGLIYFWSKYSEYCGLLNVTDLKSQSIVNILDDEYFGGYCSLLSDDVKITFDLDEDYDDNGRYGWLYSVSVLKTA